MYKPLLSWEDIDLLATLDFEVGSWIRLLGEIDEVLLDASKIDYRSWAREARLPRKAALSWPGWPMPLRDIHREVGEESFRAEA
jgi:hypothetical protein